MAVDIRTAIETALKPLLGLPLTAAGHAGDMRTFTFGDAQPSTTGRGLVGGYALHVQCSWRLTNGEDIVTGYFDYHIGNDGVSDPDREDRRRGNRQEARMGEFFPDCDAERRVPIDGTRRFVVTSVEADRFGSLDIGFNGGAIRLQVFPDSSAMEHWRFFAHGQVTPHFVIVGGKIGDDED
jgi:hypothetical protein